MPLQKVITSRNQKNPLEAILCICRQVQRNNKPREPSIHGVFSLWALGDSNPGPSGYEPDALTN